MLRETHVGKSGRQVAPRLKDRKVISLSPGQRNLANKQAESKP